MTDKALTLPEIATPLKVGRREAQGAAKDERMSLVNRTGEDESLLSLLARSASVGFNAGLAA